MGLTKFLFTFTYLFVRVRVQGRLWCGDQWAGHVGGQLAPGARSGGRRQTGDCSPVTARPSHPPHNHCKDITEKYLLVRENICERAKTVSSKIS